MPRILIVEDNRELAHSVAYNLELEGYDVVVVGDGAAALEAVEQAVPDLILLDLTLPKMDGFRVLERLRADGHEMPVVILSARGEEGDKVRGFRVGADQYVTKPFGLMELLERTRQLLKRHRPAAPGAPHAAPFKLGDVEIRPGERVIRRRGQEVSVSPKAFDVFMELYSAQGKVVSRLELMRRVWGHRGAVMSRTVDVHIAELRRKLEDDPADPQYVVTVWKKGYRLQMRPTTTDKHLTGEA